MRLASAINTVTGGLETAGTTAGFTQSDALVIIGGAINVILGLLGVAALCFIVYAGYLYMMSRGNDKEITDAKNILIYAIIGMVVIVAAYAIANYLLLIVNHLLYPVTSATLWGT